jgi:hypothetical protein
MLGRGAGTGAAGFNTRASLTLGIEPGVGRGSDEIGGEQDLACVIDFNDHGFRRRRNPPCCFTFHGFG